MSASFESFEAVLDYAIHEEEQAVELYQHLALSAERPWLKEVFLEFARQEESHREKLLTIKRFGRLHPAPRRVVDLHIAENQPDPTPRGSMTYQEALIFAMKKEAAAVNLYSQLAEACPDLEVKRTLQGLVQEEAHHKLRFEMEYEENVQRTR